MCLIIHSPVQTTIDSEIIATSFSHNQDGWGIMAFVDGEVVVHKGFKLKKLQRRVQQYNNMDVDYIVHMRMATHGYVDIDNCHPFKIGKRSYMMHNGVFSHVSTFNNKAKSDTWHFAQNTTKIFPYLDEVIDDPEFMWEMNNYTSGSRVVIMRDDGLVIRYNEDDWTKTEDGLWLSNTWSCQPKYSKADYVTDWDAEDWAAWESDRWRQKTRDNETPLWKQVANAYRDDDGTVYTESTAPVTRQADQYELSLFTTYSIQADRISFKVPGMRVNRKETAEEATIQMEMEIVDRIEEWGGPQYAPWGWEEMANAVWNWWMVAEDDIESIVLDIEDMVNPPEEGEEQSTTPISQSEQAETLQEQIK